MPGLHAFGRAARLLQNRRLLRNHTSIPGPLAALSSIGLCHARHESISTRTESSGPLHAEAIPISRKLPAAKYRSKSPKRVAPWKLNTIVVKPDGPKNIEDFFKLVSNGTATKDDAASYLMHKKLELQPLALEERRQAAAQVGAGRILNWFWETRRDSVDQDFDRAFCDLICWFLVPEGLEPIVTDWIILASATSKPVSTRPRDDKYVTARGKAGKAVEVVDLLLLGLTNALLAWDKDGTPRDAIQLLKEINHRLNCHRSFKNVNFIPSGMAIARAVLSPRSPPYDTKLFEWFRDSGFLLFIRLLSIAPNTHITIPAIQLYHPQRADPRLFMQAVNAYLRNPTDHWMHRITKTGHINSCGSYVLRAAYIYQIFGEAGKASFLKDFVQHSDKFGRPWRHRNRIDQESANDPKLKYLKESINAAGGPRPGLLEEMYRESTERFVEVWAKRGIVVEH